MLSDLIHLLSKNKVYLDNTLADKLGVDEKMAKQMLYELARLGYVENIVFSCCSSYCKACNSHCNFTNFPENRSAIWMLTEKGLKVAQTI